MILPGMENDPAPVKVKKHLPWELFGIRLSSLLTILMGTINLLSAVQPALQNRLVLIESVLPLGVRHGSRMTSALAGFGLLLLAQGLWRRKRAAWILTVLLLIVSILNSPGQGAGF